LITAGHACRTKLETVICEAMGKRGLPHEHRSLKFRVRAADGNEASYTPAIVARRGPILFLVEPVRSGRGRGAITSFSRFLEQHSPEIVFVVVTMDSMVNRFPKEAYDEIYGESAIRTLITRIRNQDPKGIVQPFEKPRPATGASKADVTPAD